MFREKLVAFSVISLSN